MITLNTIVYEGNFREVLSENSWFITFTSELITNKMITVNNIKSLTELKISLSQYPNIKIVYVDDCKDLIKSIYNLDINESTIGYYYTIPYFVSIENTTTDFILNVATDCMDDINITHEFLVDSIKELNTNDKCSSTMVAWTKKNYRMANNLTIGEYENYETFRILGKNYLDSEKFNYSFGFTDQLFLGKVDDLKKINYNIGSEVAEQIYNGPAYGGYSFEKRIVGHQILNNVCNCIYKGNDYYIHDKKYY